MRALDPASKISALGLGLHRVLSSNFVVIKIRMIVPREDAEQPADPDSWASFKSSQDMVRLERRILFSLN
jgi:hypothetical protein